MVPFDSKKRLSNALKGIDFLKKLNTRLDDVNSKLELVRRKINKIQ